MFRPVSFVAALLTIIGLAPATQAKKRIDIAPYLEVDQVFIADLKGGNNDMLTYSSVAAGIDTSIQTHNAEAQVNARYEHHFSWNNDLSDQDVLSGLARARVNVAHEALSIEGGAIATRARTDGPGGANGTLVGDNVSQIYSLYAGPTLATNMGALSVNAAYRLGYTRLDSDSSVTTPAGTQNLGGFDDSVTHSASASVGMQPGELPVGWSVGGGYDREDASQLDQRYEGKHIRADVTVPISGHVAIVGGVGYEYIEVSQRDVLVDGSGNPVIDSNGRYATDKSSPRQLSYNQDGLIWDAGVMWRPSRRTSLEVHVGRRYGSMSYTGVLSYRPSDRTSLQIAVYDGISSFGRQLNDNLANLPTSFTLASNPFSGDFSGCAFGKEKGGVCFNDTLQAISAANFRHRGIAAQLTSSSGRWDYGMALGYSRRKFIAPETGIFAGVNGGTDDNYYANLFAGRRLDDRSGIDANLYTNYFNSSLNDSIDVLNMGAYASYYRNFTNRLRGTATLGIDSIDPDGLDSSISGLAQLGLRYQF
ncbi:MAG: hypothetical protein JJE34_03360 [Alphaproteobacteria bacterium]|nr:hypothetical protein [Alphaproteobacteria bacterium]